MDLDEYKNSISKQLEFEKFLISKIETEDKIKNKNFLKKRIEKRIEIIENELNQEIQDEPEDNTQQDKREEKDESPSIIQQNTEGKDKKEVETNKTIKGLKTLKTIRESHIVFDENKVSEVAEEKKIKNQTLYDEITIRKDEYRKAVEYFINIESLKQAEDARSKVSILSKALDSMEYGKIVNEIDLPITITPDYICNTTKQERLNNFSVIIKDFSKKKNDINAQVKKAIDGYNKLEPRAQSQIV